MLSSYYLILNTLKSDNRKIKNPICYYKHMSESGENPQSSPKPEPKQDKKPTPTLSRRSVIVGGSLATVALALDACAPEPSPTETKAPTAKPPKEATTRISAEKTSTSTPPSRPDQPAPATLIPSEATQTPEAKRDYRAGYSFGEILYVTEFGGIGPDTHALFNTPDGQRIDMYTKPRATKHIREEKAILRDAARKSTEFNATNPLTKDTYALVQEGKITEEDLQRSDYDYRRPDNAVFQMLDMETKKIVPVQTLHSASDGTAPLSGEAIRQWLESPQGSDSQDALSGMMDRATSLLGTEVTITQSGKETTGEIAAVIRYDNVKFTQGIQTRNPDGSSERNLLNFESEQVYEGKEQGRFVFQSDKEYVGYFFCGRRAEDQPDNGQPAISSDRWMLIIQKDK
jgi:hypothetical protein